MRITLEQMTPDIQALLDQPVLARLATAHPESGQPHVVPVWFGWDGESIWISAFASTRKVKDLRRNPRCAVLIEPTVPDSKPQAILFEGQAELISEPRQLVMEKSLWIYQRYLGEAGVQAEDPQSWSRDPENTLICLPAREIFTW
ncbi:MAG: pyridoxamine 5'-phosphate oxidase family protein [Anaerolineales bacterium]|nr:pyridoxamine 5'-phosphate oxidase family protein [Anaerolineales bacterium]